MNIANVRRRQDERALTSFFLLETLNEGPNVIQRNLFVKAIYQVLPLFSFVFFYRAVSSDNLIERYCKLTNHILKSVRDFIQEEITQ